MVQSYKVKQTERREHPRFEQRSESFKPLVIMIIVRETQTHSTAGARSRKSPLDTFRIAVLFRVPFRRQGHLLWLLQKSKNERGYLEVDLALLDERLCNNEGGEGKGDLVRKKLPSRSGE